MTPCNCVYDDTRRLEYAYNVEEYIQAAPKVNRRTYAGYIRTPATFDIETSTINNAPGGADPEYSAFMYHWQMCIEGRVIFGRTWAEWLQLLEHLKTVYSLTAKRKLVIYVHNLSFEFMFIHRFITLDKVFATDRHKVLKCQFNGVFEMRCSYYLSNMSLQKFIENTKGRHYRKAADDLDYRVIRTPETVLTDVEAGYCYNDVRGLYEAVQGLLQDDNIQSIPMTSTGYVRRDCRNAMRQRRANRDRFLKCALDDEQYTLCRHAFRGGNTASNRYMTNMILKDVNSYDISSSYPFVMLSEKFPAGPFMFASIDDIGDLEYYNGRYCTLGYYTFENVRVRNSVPVPYVATSKRVALSEFEAYNGRILSASSVTLALTEIDYRIIQRQYDYDALYVPYLFIRRKDYLPRELRGQIYHYFDLKSELKGVAGKEYEYTKAKNKLNSIYGMCVTDIKHAAYEFDADTGAFVEGESNSLEKYYNSRNNFLTYQVGIWVTAYARRNLQQAIDRVGLDVVYCDTDSVKYVGDHTRDFERLNADILRRCASDGIRITADVNGRTYNVGLWDHDRKYDRFITLGRKKYAYDIGGRIGLTVSGLSKKDGRRELAAKGGLEAFRIGEVFEHSGRTVAYYNNDPIHNIEVDGVTIETAANIRIVDTTYTLGMTDTMLSILNTLERNIDA